MPRSILLLLLGLTLPVAAAPPIIERLVAEGMMPRVTDVRFQHGDDLEWARPDFDDHEWARGSLRDMPARDGIYWVRFRVAGVEGRDAASFSVVASYDVYWDGRLVGRSGTVGVSPESEVPGPVDNVFPLGSELTTPGAHVVALRISSFHTGFPTPTYGVVFRVARLREFTLFKSRTASFMMVGAGGALLVGVVFGLIWLLADRRVALAWFSLACMGAGLERGLQAWRWLENYPYSLHYPRLLWITGVVAVLGVLRILFMVSFFQLGNTWKWLIALLASMAAIWPQSPYYSAKALSLGSCALVISICLTLLACWKKRRGAGYVLAGLLVSWWGLAKGPTDFLEQSFIYNSGAVMVGCVIALSLQLRDERRAGQESQLAAARLEVELLKKNLQPHFLINTLATIMEVVEKEPKTAVTLIEALAGEFRILARVSGEKLIPLEQELALCRAHLRVMSLRKGARCSLVVSPEVDERMLVPPALFHTLVENGLTHLLPIDDRQVFELQAQTLPTGVRYAFVAHGRPQERVTKNHARDGTGLRYIKARLEESFTGRWSLRGEPVDEGWRTVIEMGEPVTQPVHALQPASARPVEELTVRKDGAPA